MSQKSSGGCTPSKLSKDYCKDRNFLAARQHMSPTYATNHRCRVRESEVPSMMHCTKWKFPIPVTPPRLVIDKRCPDFAPLVTF